MQKRFIVTIEIDEKNIAHKYPNYSINFRSSEEFIDLLMNDIVILGDDLEKCRMPVKAMVALYVGGMGSRKKNFYNDYAVRMGFEAEAKQIQDLYLDGKKAEAIASVPDQLVDQVALCGPADRVRDRLGIWKDASAKGHVGTMLVGGGTDALRLLAEELL